MSTDPKDPRKTIRLSLDDIQNVTGGAGNAGDADDHTILVGGHGDPSGTGLPMQVPIGTDPSVLPYFDDPTNSDTESGITIC